jgi:hypothetical protein
MAYAGLRWLTPAYALAYALAYTFYKTRFGMFPFNQYKKQQIFAKSLVFLQILQILFFNFNSYF